MAISLAACSSKVSGYSRDAGSDVTELEDSTIPDAPDSNGQDGPGCVSGAECISDTICGVCTCTHFPGAPTGHWTCERG